MVTHLPELVEVIGSREFGGDEAENPSSYLKNVQQVWDLIDSMAQGTIVLSGGAAGPDSWAHEAALHFSLPILLYRPNWRVHGKSAGFARNAEMAKLLHHWPGPKRAFAFWDGVSRGTDHSIDALRSFGIEPTIIAPLP